MSVTLRDLSKTYAAHRGRAAERVHALQRVELVCAEAELLVIVGPSGSGKSTLLRCIAGLEDPDEGRIEVGGRDVTDLPPGDRDVALVFQEHALYPHLSVADNIAFALKARRASPSEIEAKVGGAADILRLDGILGRRPGELSGGERQRVALARAIVREPKAFLMDEPLSDLDAELRTHTRAEIKSLQRRLRTTTVYVTHDQVEAMTLGDRVAVLRAGRIEQVGPPMELYDRPGSAFVARFLGTPPMNLLPSGVLGVDGAPVCGVRPEKLSLVGPAEGRARGTVFLVEAVGAVTIVHVDVGGSRVLVRTSPAEELRAGDDVGLRFSDEHVHLFESADGPALTRARR